MGVYNSYNKDTRWGYPKYPVKNVKGVILMSENTNKENLKQEECGCCSGKTKERDDKEFKDLMNRLKRIEGQVRGVENMLENDAYCTDILVQVSAITSASCKFDKQFKYTIPGTANINNASNEIITIIFI